MMVMEAQQWFEFVIQSYHHLRIVYFKHANAILCLDHSLISIHTIFVTRLKINTIFNSKSTQSHWLLGCPRNYRHFSVESA